MPTWPASISNWYLRAAAPEDVNRAQPFPYGLLFVILIASSKVGTVTIVKTGAKISSVYAGLVIGSLGLETPLRSITVGPR